MIPLAPAGIPIGIHPGTGGQGREKNRLKSFFLSPVSFASIAFGYPNAFRLGSTQTPANQPDTYNQGKEPHM